MHESGRPVGLGRGIIAGLRSQIAREYIEDRKGQESDNDSGITGTVPNCDGSRALGIGDLASIALV
jgi:hypothetical protein